MNQFDVDLMVDTVEKMVECRLKELANLSESHGVPFATSVMLSVCADIVGASLAMAKDVNMQRSGGTAFIMAMHKATVKYSADYTAQEVIEKAKA